MALRVIFPSQLLQKWVSYTSTVYSEIMGTMINTSIKVNQKFL